ncbi:MULTISPECIES: sialate O-acetylesterase [Bacillaceae]|uniref:Sialate O-acetylesterase n=1 Tax=Evansella alkalicola TaxID=745819 RepID=A0ABS6JUG0_9BACI|nr:MULTISPECIES: sialate O-acetylesterase [Bacillaceae]MBU9722210.1 sialate O-acetylesterase [Bacillus alkalicola]
MKLSSIISDGMVIQRDKMITISGESTSLQQIHLIFGEKQYETTADQEGNWIVKLDPMEAGGPYQMTIEGDDKLVINDILVGDVWVLAGQSNMEIPINRTLDLLEADVESIHNPQIRHFKVPQEYSFHDEKEYLANGQWKSAISDDKMHFSAAGYFFAEKMYEKYGVPIGLIETAVGGTPIEAWISEETLREFGGYEEELEKCKDDIYIEETIMEDENRNEEWYGKLNAADAGIQNRWFEDSVNTEGWSDFDVPNSWEGTELERVKGAVWFRTEFDLPESMVEGVDQGAKLKLGTIVDADDTYVNGTLVGNTGYRYPPRRYSIPEGVLRPGKNSIAVRVITTQSTGEFIKDMPYKLLVDGEELDLQGKWKYKIGVQTEALQPQVFFRNMASGLFKGMIAPLRNYTINGVLWYQGESNAANPSGYSKLFHALVSDWRKYWNLGEFPFIFTQLANFRTDDEKPEESTWADFREEQRKSLENPHTAMASAIDLGEYNDLHPQDKKTLGQRYALCAMKLAHDEDIVYSGPLFKKMERKGNEIHVSFDHVGSGLTAHDGDLKWFRISGEDGQFVPAEAVIKGKNSVVVSGKDVHRPQHVRYAWADNPEGANLYNLEGLPASPFTTE